MDLLIPNEHGHFAHAGLDDLQRRINRDIDSRVYLTMGILEEHRKGAATRIGRRYEAWRLNEDGSNTRLAHWRLEHKDRIFPDLLMMKQSAEGRAPSTLDQIDAANARIEAENAANLRDVLGEMVEHRSRLIHDRSNPRNRFYLYDKHARRTD